MGHRRRADLSLHSLLLEDAEGYVAPHIAVKVQSDGVEPDHVVKQLGQEVVGLDLSGKRIVRQSQALHELSGYLLPRRLGIGDGMSVVAAHGPVELAEVFGILNLVELSPPTMYEDGHLLAQSGRRGRLSVCSRQQRRGPGRLGDFGYPLNERPCLRKPFVLDAAPEHEGVREVVDVLRGAAEVYPLAHVLQRAAYELLLQIVLHRLDVVVGSPLDLFYSQGGFFVEILHQGLQVRDFALAQRTHAFDLGPPGHRHEPLDFDVNAMFDECPLR